MNVDDGGKSMELDVPKDVEAGQYANLSVVTHSNSDFVLDFAIVMPGIGKPTVKSRIILAPEQAKRFLLALQENIGRYEYTYGEIELHDKPTRTATPFKIEKGEA